MCLISSIWQNFKPIWESLFFSRNSKYYFWLLLTTECPVGETEGLSLRRNESRRRLNGAPRVVRCLAAMGCWAAVKGPSAPPFRVGCHRDPPVEPPAAVALPFPGDVAPQSASPPRDNVWTGCTSRSPFTDKTSTSHLESIQTTLIKTHFLSS